MYDEEYEKNVSDSIYFSCFCILFGKKGLTDRLGVALPGWTVKTGRCMVSYKVWDHTSACFAGSMPGFLL